MSDKKMVHAAILACVLPLSGCADIDDEAATADVRIIDRRIDALTSAQINYITGSYTNCRSRSGSWNLAISGTPPANTALSVVKGDTACTLAVTALNVGSNATSSASSPVSLGTSYGTARSFGSPIEFYANATLSSVSFSSAFTLTLLFSDDPRTATGTNTASYSVASASASASGVTAPNYTLDLSAVAVTTTAAKVTDSVSGNLTFTAGSVTGDGYVVVDGSVADTYAAIKSAYDTAVTALSGSAITMTTTVAASSVLANGVDLTNGVVRSVIIAKTTSGVTSYQKFAITFNAPS